MVLESIRQRLVDAGFETLSGREIAQRLDPATINEILELVERDRWEEKYRKFANIFPDETRVVGDTIFYARHLYPKHMEFFGAGAVFDERCFMAGNRVGKTTCGGFEATCHLTGVYPPWWVGRRFNHPTRGWAAGKTNETTRDIVQLALLGEITFRRGRKTVDGSGLIPTELIGREFGQLVWKTGFPDLVDWVKIRHVSGGWSRLGLKSYQQGRGAFEGTTQHFAWVDEEPDYDVYGEILMRLMTTQGIALLTYTPLEGLTETVLSFLPAELRPATDEALKAEDWETFLSGADKK